MIRIQFIPEADTITRIYDPDGDCSLQNMPTCFKRRRETVLQPASITPLPIK